ncbi:MAG: putative metal-binding motif-containing protein, partial [Planctomycetota bacterium]|nr:putative metal-binding motif-containing protein [Planctomycetota bacterium]
ADNGVDDNCDGSIDEGFDGDSDGFTPIGGGDCDDADPNVNPGAAEVDNGVDDNCDGNVDEGFDSDGDGFTPIAGGDCDDADPNVNPGAAEVDNGVDDNCDVNVDEGFDGDGDGFTPIAGGDCDDADPNVNPGAAETDNGIDDNCDGNVDEGTDSDGVDSATEDAAPNNGDGNSDGIPDSQQDNVASLPNVNGDYLTIASPGGTTLANVTSGNNPSPADAPAGVDFPAGFLGFEIQNVAPGGTVDVEIIAHVLPGTNIDSYWKYGPDPSDPTPHWYEFLFDGTTGATINGNVISLRFVDGQRGDGDLTANGVIVDPGGPATMPGGSSGQPAPMPDCGAGLCGPGSGLTMPFMLVGLAAMRRRKQVSRRRREDF